MKLDHEALSPIRARANAAGIGMLLIILVLLGAIGSPGEAQAAPNPGQNNFCSAVTLQPFGHNGDRCDAGNDNWARIASVTILTEARAGCANYHGWYGEYYRSWACFGNYGGGLIYVAPGDNGSYIGIIRNNNLSFSGRFWGGFYCCRP